MKRTKKEIAAIHKRSDELRELLEFFGADLAGFDPGVLCRLKGAPWANSMHFNGIEWYWLEPLLKELKERKKKG